MKAAAVVLLLPLVVSAFSPLAGRNAKSSTIARNVITSKMDWSMGEGDPEPEVRWFVLINLQNDGIESSRWPSTRH